MGDDFPVHRALDRCASRLAVASILALAALALTHCLRWLSAGAPIA